MRAALVVVGLLPLSASARADAPPSLEDALARAAKSGKPLVLEFGAEWCGPCRWFEAHVLPRSDVVTALRTVEFVRYDIDTAPGNSIAYRYQVTGVPTFLVLDANGKVVTRQAGASKNMHTWFLALLAGATRAAPSTVSMEAAVIKDPSDAHARLDLARHYRAVGRNDDALEQLRLIIEQDAVARELAAEAAAERDAIEGAEARLSQAIEAAERFVEQFPDSRLSSFRLVVLAQSGRLSRGRVHELAWAHLDAVSLADWPNAVRHVMATGHDKVATRSIEQRLAKQPTDVVHLIDAELRIHDRASGREAYATIDRLCRGEGHELDCYLFRQRQFTVARDPRLVRIRDDAQQFLLTLADPERRRADVGIESLGEIDASFGNELAKTFDRARLDCGYLANSWHTAWVELDLGLRGRPRGVRVRSQYNADLERCLQKVFAATSLPQTPEAIDGHVHGGITFAWPPSSQPQFRLPRRYGVMPQLVVRRGEIETYGFRGEFRVAERESTRWGEPRRRKLNWVVAGTVEFAGADTGEPAYVARAMAGFDLPLLFAPRYVDTSLAVGVGISDYGTRAPRAFEVPIEARYRFKLGRVRAHMWAEMTWTFLGSEIEPGVVRGGGDSTYGVGLSFPVNGVRLFLGGAYELHAGVQGAMFTFGVPLGELY